MTQFPTWKKHTARIIAYIGMHQMCWCMTCPNCTSWTYERHVYPWFIPQKAVWPCMCQAFGTKPYEITSFIKLPKDKHETTT